MSTNRIPILALAATLALPISAQAGENLFGYVTGAETLPKGAWEAYQWVTLCTDKGRGDSHAFNTKTEVEYGVTNRFSVAGSVKMQSVDTDGLIIEGYLPKEIDNGPKLSGVEGELKYNFLSPAMDPIGLSTSFSINYDWVDPHSGQDKDTISGELDLQLQKYFMEGQVILVGNFGLETTYADRVYLGGLPADFDWPTDPEMEIGFKAGTGLSYRFAPKWYMGVEMLYETEFETEVGQERWSFFLGPSVHYGSKNWWATVTWFPQLVGGGEQYEGQGNTDLHLTKRPNRKFA